jgi:hypothetical protein
MERERRRETFTERKDGDGVREDDEQREGRELSEKRKERDREEGNNMKVEERGMRGER